MTRMETAARPYAPAADRLAALGLYGPHAGDGSLGAEMRVIRRRLLRRLGLTLKGQPRRGPPRKRVVMVSGAHPGAGASFLAFNLALSFAQEDGIGALLIQGGADDADGCEGGGLWARLGLPDGPGFHDWLVAPRAAPAHSAPVHSASVHSAPAPAPAAPAETGAGEADRFCAMFAGAPLRLMRAGDAPANADLADLFAENRLGERLAAASRGGLVIIDAARDKAPAFARYADDIVLVVCAQTTRRPALVAAIDELVDTNDRIALVLNRRPGPAAASAGNRDRTGQDASAAPEHATPEHEMPRYAMSGNTTLETAEKPPHTTAKGGASP